MRLLPCGRLFCSVLVAAALSVLGPSCPTTEGFVIHTNGPSSAAGSFVSFLSCPLTGAITRPSQTVLWYRNGTAYSLDGDTTSSSVLTTPFGEDAWTIRHREELKQALAVAAIEDYDMDAYFQNSANNNTKAGGVINKKSRATRTTTTAEDLMRELEQVTPWPKPAQHPLLNARWSFVFTGVPTIGMKLITLLSRISVGLSRKVLEFDNVFLEVSGKQSQVKAIVRVQILGQPVELNVFTKLRRPTATADNDDDTIPHEVDDPKGTLLIETFDKLLLMGVEVPTPASWKSSRQLEITYLDEDMMIARTAGGEPHLLLRHSPCSTDDDTCDLDSDEPTRYFQDAMDKYGRHLSRSLVDRAYSMDDENDDDDGTARRSLDVANIVQLIRGIISSPNSSH